jgi:hypothetical protein
MPKKISLTKGQFAIVDNSDYGWLSQYNWMAQWDRCTKSYYAVRRGGIMMHREILGLKKGDKRQGDHKFGMTLDNRRAKLRRVTQQQNLMGKRIQKNNKTGFKGVTHFKDGRALPYMARITFMKVIYNLGSFTSPQLAHARYRKEANKLHGEYARFK